VDELYVVNILWEMQVQYQLSFAPDHLNHFFFWLVIDF
jgi:hypothetical protein